MSLAFRTPSCGGSSLRNSEIFKLIEKEDKA